MDVNYDLWIGESLPDVIQNIAEFRVQVFAETILIPPSISEEINFLQHYLSNEASVIVANDGGAIVGYISCVCFSEVHKQCEDYRHFGYDLRISQGPLVHPSYRNFGIGKGLVTEALTLCEIKDVSLFIIDPFEHQPEEIKPIKEAIALNFNFKSSNGLYEKEINL